MAVGCAVRERVTVPELDTVVVGTAVRIVHVMVPDTVGV